MSVPSDLHLLLSSLRGADVEAGLHHDPGFAEVDAVLQLYCDLSQSLQVLLGVRVQVLVHVDCREGTERG